MKDNTYKKPNYEWPQELPEKAYNYLVDERGISEHILKRNKVGFVDGVFKFPFIKN